MNFNNVKVYARIKTENAISKQQYQIVKKHDDFDGIVFYTKDQIVPLKYRFCQVFECEVSQEEIFNVVAKPVTKSVLQGFNGTIFAYGQTGSGKTYTMTGSPKRYQDRGIIPRSLQYIFSKIEKNEEKPSIYISYMEIYNEICYDLLNRRDSKTAIRLEELPRVSVLEDKKGEAHLRNLSVLPVSTEEEAMRLLFLGDTNRAIAETPLNEYSSRSHCIFTIYLTCRSKDTKCFRYSKLNLVDLAGSERVYKSNITGVVLNEAKHINLSLHFLQQVILALSESKRSHIPYRNSLLTFILKDSLSGRCMTAMLATISTSSKNLQETISTCKFSQRVALIKTEPVITEVSDPYQEVLLLRNEVEELKKQLSNKEIQLCSMEKHNLSATQKEECEKAIEIFLSNHLSHSQLNMKPNMINYCFQIFKEKIKMLESQNTKLSNVEQRNLSDGVLHRENGNKEKGITNTSDLNFVNQESKEKHPNMFMSDPSNTEEINYYTKLLSFTYKKAKLITQTIDECQRNINYIREKLNVINIHIDSHQKQLLGHELEHQQNIYRKSLMELKDLKNETIQLEAGLAKAKAKVIQKLCQNKVKESSILKMKETEYQKYPNDKNFKYHSHCSCEANKDKDCFYSFNNFQNKSNCHRINSYKMQLVQQCNNSCCHSYNSEICKSQHNWKDIDDIPYTLLACSCDCLRNNVHYRKQPNELETCLKYYDSKMDTGKYCQECRQYPFEKYSLPNLSLSQVKTKDQCNVECSCSNSTTFSLNDTIIASEPQRKFSNICLNEDLPVKQSGEVPSDYKKSEINFVQHNPALKLNAGVDFNNDQDCQGIDIVPSIQCQENILVSATEVNENKKEFQCQPKENYNIFVDTDSDEFKDYMKLIPLTGDEDIDKEICNFYRNKLVS